MLRFKNNGVDFPSWEVKRQGDFITFINGRAYKQEELLSQGKYIVLRVGNLFTNPDLYYSNLELEEDKYIQDGDFIYAWSAGFGPRIYHGPKCIYHYHIWKCIFDREKYDIHFLEQALLHDVDNILSQRTGGTMVHVTKEVMENRKINIPCLEEQKKIGSFLSTVDEKIALKQKKYDALIEAKKGLLQKIFSQEIRFKRDDGGEYPEWKDNILTEFANVYQPKTITSSEIKEGNYPVFGANGYIGYYTEYNHLNDQICISCRGANCGSVNYVQGPVWITGNSMVCNIDEQKDVVKKYLFAVLSRYDFKQIITGGAQPQITRNNLNITLPIPCYEEQQKIANFLSAFDEKIEAVRNELEGWKMVKKGFLQQMFC